MKRKISLLYDINKDKTMITITISDETSNSITRYIDEYMFKDFDNSVDFYNSLLDIYDAEYDDEFSNVLEELENRLVKEGVFNE